MRLGVELTNKCAMKLVTKSMIKSGAKSVVKYVDISMYPKISEKSIGYLTVENENLYWRLRLQLLLMINKNVFNRRFEITRPIWIRTQVVKNTARSKVDRYIDSREKFN